MRDKEDIIDKEAEPQQMEWDVPPGYIGCSAGVQRRANIGNFENIVISLVLRENVPKVDGMPLEDNVRETTDKLFNACAKLTGEKVASIKEKIKG